MPLLKPTQIDIFGSLRKKSEFGGLSRGSNRDAMTFEYRVPSLTFDVTPGPIAQRVAQDIATVIKTNAAKGLDPSGQPLPRASAATKERREDREEQYDRGGAAHPRYTAKGYPKARSNFKKRFNAPRVPGGPLHKPNSGPRGLFGIDSGLLFRSVTAAPGGPGIWRVFFANVRALVDRIGQSAILRVFGPGGLKVWSRQAMRQPAIQASLQAAAKGIIQKQRSDLFQSLRQTVSTLSSTLGQVSQLGQNIAPDNDNGYE